MRDYAEQVKRLRNQAKLERYYNGSGEICDDAAGALEELLAAVPHWISVEERLPEDGKDVLCWYEYYHWNKEKMLPEYGIGYCINGHWGGEVSNGRDCKVLYWMPLPDPPKGVE